MFRRVSRLGVVLCALLASAASADAYDFRIYQLGNPFPGGVGYQEAANGNFRAFARHFAAAMTAVNLMPPETLGHSAFALSAELSVVDFQGGSLPTIAPFAGPLLVPSFHFRKGLPWSFEVGVRAGWIEKSRMGTGTLELKWAINEGFTYLPDIGVRGHVTKLINSRDFDLTAGGLDLGIGKQFAIAGMVTLTPYAGWDLTFVGASTGNVDFNPSRTLAAADATRVATCGDGYCVFDPVMAAANTNNRFYGGFRLIAGVVMLGAEVSYTLGSSFRDEDTNADRSVPSLLAINSTLGLDF
jgi:hypothetical protein